MLGNNKFQLLCEVLKILSDVKFIYSDSIFPFRSEMITDLANASNFTFAEALT